MKSFYELFYFKWNKIEYERNDLLKFLKRIRLLKFYSLFSLKHKKELKILKEILENSNKERINGLLKNNENIIRISIIEKWARIGSVEILINGGFSKETYSEIIKLPRRDYRLLMKRIQELIYISKNFTVEDQKTNDNLPGT